MSSAVRGRLGATPLASGTRFEVWAPTASRVEIVPERSGTFDLASTAHPDVAGMTTWVGVGEGIGAGDRYRVRLDGGAACPDPASRSQPDGVHGPSAVVDPARFEWHDDDWTGVGLADAVLYELHVGSFTPGGTFDDAIAQLARLAELGVTLVEVMPVNAFPGTRNWGYDGVFPSAVQSSYGGPDGLARFVDAAHQHGVGVVLDVVYNHFGPEGNVLPMFGPYFTDAYDTPWGPAVNVAGPGSDGVRRYFIESAVGWIDDFHVDGLRLDAVHAIVDPTARPMVEELVEAVHRAGERNRRTVLVTLESASNDPRLVRTTAEHGWGADAVWNDDVHHALRVALTGEQHEYYAAYEGAPDLAAALEHRWVYRGQYSPTLDRRHGARVDDVDPAHFVVFSTNHDHVGNTPRGERMLHDADTADPRRRLAAAFVLLSPFTPLLFMGEEYGESAPFPYFVDHGDPDLVEAVRRGRRAEFADVDWAGGIADPADPATFSAAMLDPSLADSGSHAGLLAMYTELIRLRRDEPIITDPDAEQRVVLDAKLLTVIRTSTSWTSVARFNFSDESTAVSGADAASGLDVMVDDDALRFDSASDRWGAAPTTGQGLPPFSARLWVAPRD